MAKTKYYKTYASLGEEPRPELLTSGWEPLDRHFKPYHGMLLTVTGAPGSGKSAWTMCWAIRQAHLHGKCTAMALFENDTHDFKDMLDVYCNVQRIDAAELYEKHFRLFERKDRDVPDLGWFKDAVDPMRDWADWVILDPYNQVESDRVGLSSEQQQKQDLRSLHAWKGKDFGLVIVAHPTKGCVKEDGTIRRVTGWDISGSAHWKNRCDYIICLNRGARNDENMREYVELTVDKVRRASKQLHEGEVWFKYCEHHADFYTARPPNEA